MSTWLVLAFVTLLKLVASFHFLKQWCVDDGFQIHPSIEIRETEHGGRGVFATSDIDPDVILLSIPVQCCIFEATLKYNQIDLPSLNISNKLYDGLFSTVNDVALALYLTELKLLDKLNQSSHYFFPYIHSLPKSPNTPLFWSPNMRQLINHTSAYYQMVSQYKHITYYMKHSKILTEVKSKYLNEFYWSFSMVSSRMWNVNIKRQFKKSLNIELNRFQTNFGTIPIFVPAADMFNHYPQKSSISLKYNKETETVNIETFDEIDKNEEIFINYGHKSNSILLAQYGFILKDNPYNYSTYDLFMNDQDINFDVKQTLLNQFGLTKLKFTADGLDWLSAKGFFIASLPPKFFSSHIISKILSVPHNSYWISNVNKLIGTDKYDQNEKQFLLSNINRNELEKISQKLKKIKELRNIYSFLTQSLCERCGIIEYHLDLQNRNGWEIYRLECSDYVPTMINHFCETLDMILEYLKSEGVIFASCKDLYCFQ